MTTYELFSVRDEGDAGWAHGRAFATGVATTNASFRRGIDLSASIDLEAALDVEASKILKVELAAGGMASAGLSLTAASPLDLFTEAGLVARLRAQAAAAAFVRADIGLDLADLAKSVAEELKGPWREIAEIFMSADEVVIGAGLWAAASISAQALAEAAIVGSLQKEGGQKPGFTCSFKYMAGYGAGAGMDYRVNFDIADPARLFDRIADRLTAIIEREAQDLIANMPEADRAAPRQALSLLRLVLPLAFRTAFEQGFAQVKPTQVRRTVATTTVVGTMIHESQEQLSRALLSQSIEKVNSLLHSPGMQESFQQLSRSERASAKLGLDRAKAAIVDLTTLEPGSEKWFKAVLTAIEEASKLTPFIDAAQRDQWNDSLALAWAAALVVQRVVVWNSAQGESAPLFDATPVALPSASPVAAHIAGKIKKPAGEGLSSLDAVEFILIDAPARLAALRSSFMELGSLLDLLASMFQDGAGESLLHTLFQRLASPENIDPAALLPKLTAALQPVVEGQIMPNLLVPFEGLVDVPMVEMVRQVVKPTILSLTRVVLPGVINVDTEAAATVLREQISAVLLQSLSRSILVTTDLLAQRAAQDGSEALHELALEIRAGRAVDTFNRVLAKLALDSAFPLLQPAKEQLSDLLDLSADTIGFWNDHQRTEWMKLLETAIGFGLSTGTDIDQIWSRLAADPNAPLVEFNLGAIAGRLQASTWELVTFLASRLWDIVTDRFERWGKEISTAIQSAVESALATVREAAEWLDEQIEQLEARIRQLAQDIQAAVAAIAGHFRTLALQLAGHVGAAIEAVRAWGWSKVRAALFDNDVFKFFVPANLQAEAERLVQVRYNKVFDNAKHFLTTPLHAFARATGWVQEALTHQLQIGTLDRNAVLNYVREQALSLGAQQLTLEIITDIEVPLLFSGKVTKEIKLPPIHLAPHDILGMVVNALMSPMLGGVVDQLINRYQQVVAKTSQLNAAQTAHQGALDKDEANQALDSMTTGQPLGVRIDAPGEKTTHVKQVDLQVVLTGANRTFLTSVLGVAPRVKVFVNGQEHRYAAGSWTEEAGGLVYRATVVSSSTGLVPLQVLPDRYLEVRLPKQFKYVVTREAHGIRQLQAAPVGQLSRPPRTPSTSPGASRLIETLRSSSRSTSVDPLLGIAMNGIAEGDTIRPVVVQQLAPFEPTAEERVAGFRWVMPEGLIHIASNNTPELKLHVFRETILAYSGLNRIDIVVVDGDGRSEHVGRTFYLHEEA
jgi:hypothetical protein